MSRKRRRRANAVTANTSNTKPPVGTPPVLAAVVGVYVVVLAAMVAFDRYVFLTKGLIVPVLLLAALVSGRGARFVNDWAVYLAGVVFLEFCRGLTCAVTTHFELPMYVDYVLRWERELCGGAIAPVSLQHLRAVLADPRWLDRVFVLVYSSHYLFFLLLGFVLWYKQRDAFRTYTIAIPAVIAGGVVGCALVPTVPPWMAANDFLLLPPIVQIVRTFYNLHLPVLVAVFDVNPIAAMPSLHAALPAMCALLALRYFGRRGLLVVGYALVVCVAVVYLGEHFLVDVVAGWVLAVVVYGAVAYWERTGAAGRRSWSEPQEHWAPRPIAIALLLVAAAVGTGQLSARWLGPLPITRPFVERELMGRSPLARYLLGRIAYAAGDFAEAQAEFTAALQDLPAPDQQQVIRTLLADSAAHTPAPGGTIAR